MMPMPLLVTSISVWGQPPRPMPRSGGAGPRAPRQGLDRGFTLIELLVVIAVLALLVAILVPALMRAKNIARAALCASNLRQIGVMFHSYSAEYRYFPSAFGPTYPFENDKNLYEWRRQLLWAGMVPHHDYLSHRDYSAKGLACPSTRAEKQLHYDGLQTFTYCHILGSTATPTIGGNGSGAALGSSFRMTRPEMVSKPAETLAIVESNCGNGAKVTMSWDTWGYKAMYRDRHLDAANYLYGDASVQRLSKYRVTYETYRDVMAPLKK